MLTLSCGTFTIPLFCVQSISWTKKAKVITHAGGYVSSRGFETSEISVKIHAEYTILKQLGFDADSILETLTNIVTDRSSESGVFYFGGYPIYPELEFTPTNINKTYTTDSCVIRIMELDMVFSGVKATKEVFRQRSLEVDTPVYMPELTLTVDGKSLNIRDSFQLNEFTTQPDSISLSMSIGSDMDLRDREGFLNSLLKGTVEAFLPQGKTVYYIIDANLVEESLSITASIYPPQAMKTLTRTYQNTTIKDILLDLAKEAGVELECLVEGKVDYYRAFASPVQCIKEIQAGAGFIISYRQGKLTCADVPESIEASEKVDYNSMEQDSNSERISGIYWFDGVNQFTAGELSSTSRKVYSPFRSSQDYSTKCLNYLRYLQNQIVVTTDIMTNVDSHSLLLVQSNDKQISTMCEYYENDWVLNTARLELHYIGG